MDSPPQSSFPPPESVRVPQVRARHTQMLLRIAEEHVAPGTPSFAATLDAETRAVVAAADPSTWLPMELALEIMEAIARRFGPEGTASILDARQREELESVLLAGLLKMVLQVFAPSPASLVKHIPEGWGRLYRNAGWVEIVSTGRSDAVIRFHRLPAMCIASEVWMAGLPMALRSLYALVGATGTVDCRIEDAAEGTALMTFRWRSERAPQRLRTR